MLLGIQHPQVPTMCDTFTAIIPRHCSALRDTPISIKAEPERKRPRPRPPKVGILIVQGHLDRAVWNAFVPMVLSSSKGDDCALLKACMVLRRHYKRQVQYVCQKATTTGETKLMDETSDDDDFYRQTISAVVPHRRKRKRPRHILVIVLPPYPRIGCTSPPTLEPERLFTSRLVRLENIMVRLQSLNAFFSTLGGGYFLCRYLTTAVQLARWQRTIALSLGDRDLAARCTVNEAYNYIHAGKLKHAFHLIKKVKEDATKRGDMLTVSMCKSARYFAKRVQKNMAFEGSKQGVDDELQRIRIVADHDKINRTFRPLHEL